MDENKISENNSGQVGLVENDSVVNNRNWDEPDKNDWKYNIFLKAAAFVVAVASMIAVMIFGVCWLYGQEGGYYETENFFETNACRYIINEQAWDAVDYYAYEGVDSKLENEFRFSNENTNIGVEIAKLNEDGEAGKTLATSFVPEKVGHYVEIRNGSYMVKCSVAEDLTVKDDLYWAEKTFDIIAPKMDKLPFAAGAGVLLWLFCTIYLMCAAGHRPKKEGITPNLLDKIPVDLYLAAVAGVVIGMMCMLVEVVSHMEYYSQGSMILMAMAGTTAVMGTLVMGFLLSAATRIKIGGWWRNSITYMILRLLWKLCRGAGRGSSSFVRFVINKIPVVWKTAVGSTVMIFLIILFAGIGYGALFIAMLLGMLTILFLIYCALCMRALQKGGRELAGGNEDYRVNTDRMKFDFAEHGENLNNIGKGMSIAVAQRMKSERMKTELITNVSHDLKTPLTSIINYVDLLSKEDLNDKATEYVEVLKRQSARLKKLTEDVVEASKASTGNIQVNLTNTDPFEIMNQAIGEYRERLEENKLELILKNEEEEAHTYISADGRLLWRAIDNLMNNICKYSQQGTRVYATLEHRAEEVVLAFKNISREELDISSDELMERFVRGDSSRTTEGSGLGLNIARSLVEIQGGSMKITIDGDLFKAEIIFRKN